MLKSAPFTHSLAFAEAIWNLVNSNVLMLSSSYISEIQFNIGWTTEAPSGGGGSSSGWQFEQHKVFIPSKVRLAPSCEHSNQYALLDGDLYIKELNIEDLHEEVREALRQAVKCFRYELYIPCVTMLARAAEGAWTEAGLSLLKVDLGNPKLNTKKRQEAENALTSEYSSFVRKMETVIRLYRDYNEVFDAVAKQSGYSHRYLEEVSIFGL